MSSIVGFRDDDGKVYMGADSAAVDTGSFTIRDVINQKIFYNGELLIGVAGSTRVSQIMEHCFTPPPHDEELSDNQYICSTLIRSIMECLMENNYKLDGTETVLLEGQLMIGYRSKLYIINSDFGVTYDIKFDAIGCGSEHAVASIHTSLELMKELVTYIPIETILTIALNTSAEYSMGVRGPFDIYCMHPKQ